MRPSRSLLDPCCCFTPNLSCIKMSQPLPSDSSAVGHQASSQALTSAVVDGIAQQVVQPLENRLQAHDQRFNEFESRSTEFQNTVLTLLGSRGSSAPGPSARARSSGRRRASTVPRPDKNSETQMQVSHVLFVFVSYAANNFTHLECSAPCLDHRLPY